MRLSFAVLAALVAGLGLLATGCGGGKADPSVASLGTTATTRAASTSTTGGGATGTSGPATSSGGGGGTMSMAGGSVEQMTRFAACMRRNGEPSFPDPNAQGQISANVDPGSAQFQHAQQACRKWLPHGGAPNPAQQARLRSHALAFAACMRSHGLPKFPDPQFGPDGSVSQKITIGSGLDPRSPQFQAAQKACAPNLPGKLGATPAVAGSKTAGGGSSSG